jgi:hypothetical protein
MDVLHDLFLCAISAFSIFFVFPKRPANPYTAPAA